MRTLGGTASRWRTHMDMCRHMLDWVTSRDVCAFKALGNLTSTMNPWPPNFQLVENGHSIEKSQTAFNHFSYRFKTCTRACPHLVGRSYIFCLSINWQTPLLKTVSEIWQGKVNENIKTHKNSYIKNSCHKNSCLCLWVKFATITETKALK